MEKNVLDAIIDVPLPGGRYKVAVVMLAEEKTGEQTRPCVACHNGHTVKELFKYKLLRFQILEDEKSRPLFSHVAAYLYQQIERDKAFEKMIVDEASRILNSWSSDLLPIDANAPEFQADGRCSLDERLNLCDECVVMRQVIALELPLMETDRAA